jgi:iron complex outermembrane receptor protein
VSFSWRTAISVASVATCVDPLDRFSIAVFVANALDEEYRVAALPVATARNFTHYGPPLSYGVRFNARF